MIWRYWDLLDKPEKRVIISRKNAYHGSTVAASSLGGMEAMHKQGGIIPDIVHVEQPYWFGKRCETGAELDAGEVGKQAAQSIADKIEELGGPRLKRFAITTAFYWYATKSSAASGERVTGSDLNFTISNPT